MGSREERGEARAELRLDMLRELERSLAAKDDTPVTLVAAVRRLIDEAERDDRGRA